MIKAIWPMAVHLVTDATAFSDWCHCTLWLMPLHLVTDTTAFSDWCHCTQWLMSLHSVADATALNDWCHFTQWFMPLHLVIDATAFSDRCPCVIDYKILPLQFSAFNNIKLWRKPSPTDVRKTKLLARTLLQPTYGRPSCWPGPFPKWRTEDLAVGPDPFPSDVRNT